MKSIKNVLKQSFIYILIFTILCGIVYTVVVTLIAKVILPNQSTGSIITVNGKNYGSELLGQQYTDDAHMWGRIMKIDTQTFTDENGNVLMYSGPYNLSPASKEYEALVKERVDKIKKAHPEKGDVAIPVDLVTGSGSGLDPHISINAAEYQKERIAQNNNISVEDVQKIIDKCTTSRFLGIFGEKTVNVLKVNLMLDGIL